MHQPLHNKPDEHGTMGSRATAIPGELSKPYSGFKFGDVDIGLGGRGLGVIGFQPRKSEHDHGDVITIIAFLRLPLARRLRVGGGSLRSGQRRVLASWRAGLASKGRCGCTLMECGAPTCAPFRQCCCRSSSGQGPARQRQHQRPAAR
eukprot:scaffold27835_cov122-Isochrysis_galbana.AAC.6